MRNDKVKAQEILNLPDGGDTKDTSNCQQLNIFSSPALTTFTWTETARM